MNPEIEKKIDAAFTKYPKRIYPKGQIVIFGGEEPSAIYYIKQGRIREYDISYRGDEVIVNMFKPPAFFPMSWAINRSDNPYFFKAEIDSELHIVPADEALAFIKENPDVMLDLLSRVYKGMVGLFGRIVHLMSGTAKSRLLYELIIECRRFGEHQKDGSFVLNIKESDLASRSGLSRETVNRELQTVKKDGLVLIGNKGIIVKDLKALEKKLGSEV